MNFKIKYDIIYGIVGLLLILMAFTVSGSADLAIHDYYVVIPKKLLIISFAGTFLLFASVVYLYRKINRNLNRKMLLFHLIISSTTALSIIVALFFENSDNVGKRYENYDAYDQLDSASNFLDYNSLLTILFLISILAQILFVYNMIFALFKKK